VTVTRCAPCGGRRPRRGGDPRTRPRGRRPRTPKLLVNGKRVARQLFTWGVSPGERLYRLAFDWDTKNVPRASTGSGSRRLFSRGFVAVRQPGWTLRSRCGSHPREAGFPDGEAAGGSGRDGSRVREIARRRIMSFLTATPARSDFRSGGVGIFSPLKIIHAISDK